MAVKFWVKYGKSQIANHGIIELLSSSESEQDDKAAARNHFTERFEISLKSGGIGIFHNFSSAPQSWMKSSELALRDKWDFTKDPHMTETEKPSILP